MKVRGWLYSEPNLALIAAADAADELEAMAKKWNAQDDDSARDYGECADELMEKVRMLRGLT